MTITEAMQRVRAAGYGGIEIWEGNKNGRYGSSLVGSSMMLWSDTPELALENIVAYAEQNPVKE